MTLESRIEALEQRMAPATRGGRWRMVEILTDGLRGPPVNEEEAAKLAAARAAAAEAGDRLIVAHLPIAFVADRPTGR